MITTGKGAGGLILVAMMMMMMKKKTMTAHLFFIIILLDFHNQVAIHNGGSSNNNDNRSLPNWLLLPFLPFTFLSFPSLSLQVPCMVWLLVNSVWLLFLVHCCFLGVQQPSRTYPHFGGRGSFNILYSLWPLKLVTLVST